MSPALLLMLVCAVPLALPGIAAAPEFTRYRDITLGDGAAAVVERLKVPMSDLKVVHERPTLVQQLTWRPHRFVSGTTVEPDPLSEMVLTFHLGRLAHIAVVYDRDRTAGLTDADLHEVFAKAYGTSQLLPTPRAPARSTTEPEVVGRWGDDDTLVLLWRESYPSRIKLTIASIAADRVMQAAIGDGVRLDATEAPSRELARRAAEEEALRLRNEKLRRDNKAGFKP